MGEWDKWRGRIFFLVKWEELMVWNWLFVVMVKRGRWMFGREDYVYIYSLDWNTGALPGWNLTRCVL